MKIGLFFGSFNPIHIGHVIIGNIMAEQTDLDQVWFVVTPQNPFKKNKNLLHEFDRLTMVERAIADNHKLKACDIEFQLPKPSYTIDTLTYIQEKYPKNEFILILGEDNLNSLSRWKNYEQILEHYGIYVYPRPNSKIDDLPDYKNVSRVEAPLLDISATFIRNAIKKGQSIRYIVPDPVQKLIELKGYYL